ncbi:MAG: poly-beta-1,6 N-acetyl-D-glucosamine export porin PgaA [Herminiimonas sp.]|uniref:poly-beta-1,6 N-acetyl-D-glucosamine export porin PgaA n=1 Tax=Herminiimonas sp. TaxID=1926289 RepID=UPI002727C0CB|nr:poly-beta-1,6 N-acetyl-D-glucosamine export porin PgaA [Herminiimonas sp.]MDO9422494.1 poly-beta-1,6 N-acetyl-D-glucosamine export porin PgaA [Herminiimonas sp.]
MHKKYQHLKITKSGFACFVLGLCATSIVHAAIPQAEYDGLIRSARDGQAAAAVEKLTAWHNTYSDDQKILYDLVVVLGWAGDYNTALTYYDQLVKPGTPAYVLKSLANSANKVERWDQAEKAYRLVLNKTPADYEARAGLVDAMFGQNRSDEALQYVQGFLPKFTSAYKAKDVQMITLLGSVYTRRGEHLLAANTYQNAVRLDPQSREAFRSYVFALDAAGMPYLAARTAERNIDWFSAEEQRQIAHAGAGRTVNFGQAQLNVDYKQQRFATTDTSLTENQKVTDRFGEKPVTQFDRMVALRDRQQMTEVIELYQSLKASGVDIPPYAKAAAADAYLYLEQPESARDLYMSAIEEARAGDVATVDAWQIGLTYAYSESEQHDLAQATADRLFETTPPFANAGIPGVQAPNEDYPTAAVLTVLVRMYADRLQQAEDRLVVLRQNAPFNQQVRGASADLRMARGHPRAALSEYELMHVDDPKAIGPQIGRGNALLALNEFTEAKQVLPALQNDYPENKGVQNFARQLDIYDRPYLQVTSTFGKGGGIAGAESVIDARLYSAPLTNSLGDPFRVFSHVSHSDGHLNEGTANDTKIGRSRIGVGLDYRVRDLMLSAEINRAIENANRSGVAFEMTKDFSDTWQMRLLADSNVNDLAARAYNSDVTAKRVTAGLTWRQNESRSIDGEISNTHFSDDNRRDAATLAWTERWVSGPVFKMDSILGLATSRNSAANAAYFNPSSDKEATATLVGEWKTWRRYRRSMTQQVQVYGGRYWQEGFASGATSGAQYGHVWSIDDAFTLSYGIGTSKHPYDGAQEKRHYGYLNLNWAIK